MKKPTQTEEPTNIERTLKVTFEIYPSASSDIRLHEMAVKVSYHVALQENDECKVIAKNALKACTDQLKAAIRHFDFDATELTLTGGLEFSFHEDFYASPVTSVRVGDVYLVAADIVPGRIDNLAYSILGQFNASLTEKRK